MIALVQALQALSGVAWLALLVLFTPPLWRVLRGTADLIDMIRAPKWVLAFVMVLGAVRWLAFSGALHVMAAPELSFWALIYVANIGAAGGIAWAWHLLERLRR